MATDKIRLLIWFIDGYGDSGSRELRETQTVLQDGLTRAETCSRNKDFNI